MELTGDLVDVAVDAFKMAEPTLNKTQRMLVSVEAVLHSLPQPVQPAALTDEEWNIIRKGTAWPKYGGLRDVINSVYSRRTAQPAEPSPVLSEDRRVWDVLDSMCDAWTCSNGDDRAKMANVRKVATAGMVPSDQGYEFLANKYAESLERERKLRVQIAGMVSSESVTSYHHWIRESLKLPADAPLRFDYYAEKISKMHTTDAVEKAILEEDGYLLSYKDSNAVAISVCARLDRLAAPSKTPGVPEKPAFVNMCMLCGSLVDDHKRHMEWHAKLEASDGTHL